MTSPARCVITTDTKTLNKDGILHLLFHDDNLLSIKTFISSRGLRPGSSILVQLIDKESKSYEQLKTVHLLLRIYDTFLQANIEGYIDINDLKNKMKYKYGVIEYWEASDGTTLATLKSFAEYKMSELKDVISGMMDEMIKVFAEYRHEDKRFSEMIKEFNSQKIENIRKQFQDF